MGAVSEPVSLLAVEQEVDPPGQKDGQREVDQQQVAIDQSLALDAGDEVEEVVEGGLAAQRRQQADGGDEVPDPPLAGFGSAPVSA